MTAIKPPGIHDIEDKFAAKVKRLFARNGYIAEFANVHLSGKGWIVALFIVKDDKPEDK